MSWSGPGQLNVEARAHAQAERRPAVDRHVTLDAGLLAIAMDDLPRAEALLEEALDLHQRYNGPYPAAFAQGWLGEVVLARGDVARAATLDRDAIAGFAAAGHWAIVANNLEKLAEVTVTSQPAPTVRLLGAAAALRARFDNPRDPAYVAAYDRVLTTARTQLGEAAFTEAWAAGQQLAQEEAVAEADGAARPRSPRRGTPPTCPRRQAWPDPRELEVLRLVAGRSLQPRDRRDPLAQ